MLVYLGHPISDKANKLHSKKITKSIRELGFEVYAAAENDSINDKGGQATEVTPELIYDGDIPKVISSDLFVVNLTGGNQDGTNSEIGVVAGWNEALKLYNELIRLLNAQNGCKDLLAELPYIKIIAYSTNERIMSPQHFKGIASASVNHLILGEIEKWGTFVGNEDDMLEYLKHIDK